MPINYYESFNLITSHSYFNWSGYFLLLISPYSYYVLLFLLMFSLFFLWSPILILRSNSHIFILDSWPLIWSLISFYINFKTLHVTFKIKIPDHPTHFSISLRYNKPKKKKKKKKKKWLSALNEISHSIPTSHSSFTFLICLMLNLYSVWCFWILYEVLYIFLYIMLFSKYLSKMGINLQHIFYQMNEISCTTVYKRLFWISVMVYSSFHQD